MQDLTAILEAFSTISSTLTLDESLEQFTKKITQITGAENCTISHWNLYKDSLTVLTHYVSPDNSHAAEKTEAGMVYFLADYPASFHVLHHHTPLFISVNDPTADRAEKALLTQLQWSNVLIMPMLYREQAVGFMKLYSDDNGWQKSILKVLPLCQALANQAAIAIENDQLYERAKDERLHAEAMQVISRALTSDLDYQRIVHNVADVAYRLVNSQFICVAVPEGDQLFPVAIASSQTSNGHRDFPKNISLSLPDQGPLTRILQGPVVVADIEHDSAFVPWRQELQQYGWRAMVVLPLFARNEFLGVLIACASEPNAFSHNEVEVLMSLASQAAVAIQNASLFAELDTKRKDLHKMSLRLVNAQEEERRRIARELHDELGQALTALKINLDLARRGLPPDASDQLCNSIQEASILARQTLETARSISLELHPAILDDLGLAAALRWATDRYQDRLDLKIELDTNIDKVQLRAELKITIYRIITEALTNAVRHAQAKHISIQVYAKAEQIIIVVQDDGVGFAAQEWLASPAKHESLGLMSMKERAELLGGTFKINSETGQGTSIWATLPIAVSIIQ